MLAHELLLVDHLVMCLDPFCCIRRLSPLQFPCHLYYLNQSSICKYSVATKQSGALLSLTPDDAKGKGKGYKPHTPTYKERLMVHSAKQNAWLVFFERSTGVTVAAPGAAAVAAGPTGGTGAVGAVGSTDSVGVQAAAPGGMQLPPGVIAAAAAAMAAAAEKASGGGAGAVGGPAAAGPTGGAAAAGPTGGGATAAGGEGAAAAAPAPVAVRVVPPTTVWEFTLIRGGHNDRVTWFLPGAQQP